jgi:DNA topoisomerase IA
MKIVLITEKPSFGTAVIPFLLEAHPDMDLEAFSMGYTGFYIHLNSAFSFPRGEAYSSFPQTGDVNYRDFNFIDERYAYQTPRRGWLKVKAKHNPYANSKWSMKLTHAEFVEDILAADIIYFAVDAGPSGFYAQLRVVEWLSQFNRDFDRRHIVVQSLDDKSLREAIKVSGPLADLRERSQLSIARRYFDYNYLRNAFPILGLTATKALGRPFGEMLTKHALQVLYFLRDHSGFNDGTLCEAMQRWVGSGRYERDGNLHYQGVGSPATRTSIIKSLLHEKLAKRVGKTGIEISDDGRRFLDFLHPDCEDVDQVFRIHEFSKMPEEEAKAKIDRYIMTFFGKQKRYLPKITRKMA